MKKYRISIKIIVPLVVLLSILIPLIFLNLRFYTLSADNINKQYKQELSSITNSFNMILNEHLAKYAAALDVLSSHPAWQAQNAYNKELTQRQIADYYDDIQNLPNPEFREIYADVMGLINLYERDEAILTIYYGTPKHNFFGNSPDNYVYVYGDSDDYELFDGKVDCVLRPWYLGAVESKGKVFWTDPYIDRADKDLSLISASKAVYNSNNELMGVMAIDIDVTDFYAGLQSLNTNSNYKKLIVNKDGIIIFSIDNKEIGQEAEDKLVEYIVNGEGYYEDVEGAVYSKKSNHDTDWYVMKYYSNQILYDQFEELGDKILRNALITLALVLLATFLLSYYLISPIDRLTKYLKRVHDTGNLNDQMDESLLNLRNEYGLLAATFQKLQNKIKIMTYRDQLTGLKNRYYFENLEVELISRDDVSIIMSDANGLKLINEAHGHIVGDRYLAKIGEVLKEVFFDADIIRWGGDEFLIVSSYSEEIIREKIDKFKKISEGTKVEEMSLSLAFGYSLCKDNLTSEKIAHCIEKADAMMSANKIHEYRSAKRKIIDSILASLYGSFNFEKQHSENVMKYSLLIGKQLKFPEYEMTQLRLGALIHDVGKIGIPDYVINKKGPLDEEEWDMIRKHPEKGFRIIMAYPEMDEFRDYVLSHHERIDGKGYPRGLVGDEIPLIARIVCIADAFDAMTSVRPYKEAYPKEKAIDELIKNKGTQFDAELVDLFVKAIKDN